MGCINTKSEELDEVPEQNEPFDFVYIEPLYSKKERDIQCLFWCEYLKQEFYSSRLSYEVIEDFFVDPLNIMRIILMF